jgi:transcriptional regulator with XRE-family HTH domain
MKESLKKFGLELKGLRLASQRSIREVCKHTGYDPSNWSKIERGILPPPTNEKVLGKWAKALELDKTHYQSFFDSAKIAQGIIPEDIISGKVALECMPAFFRTLRNEKPSQEEIKKLIKLIKGQK